MRKDVNQLRGKRILVVEDEYLVAQVIIDYLEDAGAEVLGPLGQIEDVLAFIKDHHSTLDAAVLDINLHGQKSYPIADALAVNNIVFVFTTGYGGETLESRYQRFTRCLKPFNQETFIAALCQTFAEAKDAKQFENPT